MGVALPALDRQLRARRAAAPPASSPADSPLEIPTHTWTRIAKHAFLAALRDNILLVAAGITFYALLAIFPAIAAFVSLYGLFADVGGAEQQVGLLNGLVPGGAVTVIGQEMTRLAGVEQGRLGVSFVISLLISVWSANAGMKALMSGLNVAYERREARGFFKLTAISLGFTFGGTVVAVIGIASIVAAPGLLNQIGLGGFNAISPLRWPAFLVLTVAGLAIVYRYGPCRPNAHWRWVSPGSLFAGVAWLGASLAFSWYVAHFGSYNRTYGSLGAIVGFMTWIWMSLIVVLLGAELNAEMERQTHPQG